jgi:branched-chain amino acid transport system permease protein
MFVQQLINGLTLGSTYALVAIGYSMVFGILQLINFANGSMYMLGAYVSLMLYLAMNGQFWIAFGVSVLVVGTVGYGMDRFALRTLRKKKAPRLAGLISTMGVSIFLENFIALFFGSEAKPFPNMIDFGKFEFAGAIVHWTQVIIFLIAVVLMVLLSIIVYRTKFGKAMRATSQNTDAARLMGINVPSVISITFIISGALAAIAGVLVSMYYQSIDVTMGLSVGMKTFASAVLGGIGVLPGAMVGGLAVGVIETIGASYIDSGYRNAIAFVILILVLIFKPTGLFGKKKMTKV